MAMKIFEGKRSRGWQKGWIIRKGFHPIKQQGDNYRFAFFVSPDWTLEGLMRTLPKAKP